MREAGRVNAKKITHPEKIRALFVFSQGGSVFLGYQNQGNAKDSLCLSKSDDGFAFQQIDSVASIKNQSRLDLSTCDDFRVSGLETSQMVVSIKREEVETWLATSNYVSSWALAEKLPYPAPGAVFSVGSGKNNFYLFSDGTLKLAKKATTWKKAVEVVAPRPDRFDSGPLEFRFLLETEQGWLVLYSSKTKPEKIGALVLDKFEPTKVNWRANEPVWEQTPEWKGREVRYFGSAAVDGKVISYYQLAEGIYGVIYAYHVFPSNIQTRNVSLALKKDLNNPIISPNSENPWESFNTFNPAAVFIDGKVHLLYRAQGYDYISVLGYASLENGIYVHERFKEPVFSSRVDLGGKRPNWNFMSGGGYGGVEDPRLTKIGNRIYMTYVAYDGYSPPRVALTSISIDDFVNHRWLWEKPVLISPPGIVDKNAVIFPEKVKGKYVIFHRVFPDILIDFVDDLNFDGKTWLKGEYRIEHREKMWDSRKLGAGAPPIKTKDGWLLIYQAVDDRDPGRYKIGAMLLDLEDPTKVLYRTNNPILEPVERYENEGFKAGVAYPCGAVVINGTMYVYYGAADSYVCVAVADLDEFLAELKYGLVVKLNPARIEKVM